MTRLRRATAGDEALVQAITEAAYAQYLPILGYPPVPVTEPYGPRIAAGEVWLLEDAGLLVIERHPDHAMIFSKAGISVKSETLGPFENAVSHGTHRDHGGKY